MRRIVITCLTLVAAALLVLPAAASAAPAKDAATAAVPQITRVQPMRISVGGTLTITGRRFKSTRTKNTVIFRASDGRTAFVKPRRATTTQARPDRVPASVARLLKVANSRQQPTRLKLRVLAGKFSKFTPKRLSPVVTAAGRRRRTRRRWRRRPRGLRQRLGSRQRPAGEQPRAVDRHRPLPRGHGRRPDDGRLGVLVREGPERQGRALPRQASVPERARPERRGAGRYQLQQHRLRRRRPHDARGVPRVALHRQQPRHRIASASGSSPRSATATARSSAARATSRPRRPSARPSYGLANPTQPFPASYDFS